MALAVKDLALLLLWLRSLLWLRFNPGAQEFPNALGLPKKKKRSSCCVAEETNPTRNQEVAGSIPGLTQWVKDLALP